MCMTLFKKARLKRFRKIHGYTQEQFAALVGCKKTSIQKIESGKTRAGIPLALKIEKFTGGEVTAAYLTELLSDDERKACEQEILDKPRAIPKTALTEYRKSRGLTLAVFGIMAGVSASNLCTLEKGNLGLSKNSPVARRIREATGGVISVEYLTSKIQLEVGKDEK